MKNREQKAEAISQFTEGIGSATNAFVLDFKGITVPQVTELRRQILAAPSGGVHLQEVHRGPVRDAPRHLPRHLLEGGPQSGVGGPPPPRAAERRSSASRRRIRVSTFSTKHRLVWLPMK